MTANRSISLRGVSVHNLKSIDLDIPHRKLVVLCGVSGSGKSSLAFDTLYAEGQRRYIESFSPYARQFLERLEKPDADRIDGIPPAIAVRQAASRGGACSTVATATEIHDYLRLLFARVGRVHCIKCERELRKDSPDSVAEWLVDSPTGARYLIAFADDARDTTALIEAGFVRAIDDGALVELNASNAKQTKPQQRHVIVDRLTAGAPGKRVRDSLETAFQQGRGRCEIIFSPEVPARPFAGRGSPVSIDGAAWWRIGFSNRLRCDDCDIDYPEPEPRLFSFHSPLGACPTCEGAGVVPEAASEGAKLTKKAKARLRECLTCNGLRLRPESLAVRVGGQNIAQVVALESRDALKFLSTIEFSDSERQVARRMLEQLRARLEYLERVGLGYLTLDRSLRTLSGGEAHRVSLATAIGSSLVNMLYVLDEPTVGLHPIDTAKLLSSIRELCNRGNTVVVVEHEETLLRAADHLIEIGPGAGERGGQVTFQGAAAEIEHSPKSITGDYLSGRREIRTPERRRPPQGWIRLTNARGANLKGIDVKFPLGVICVVTGVSGAGKSSLVHDTLYPALCAKLHKDTAAPPLPFDDLEGESQIDDVILVDQSPVGRSPRSNPITYVKAFDEIRALFAETLDARTHNFTAGHFSFNVEGGRCDKCEGDGVIKIDMQFLPDVYIKCSECRGRRYRNEILAVRYRARNIAEVLDLTVREAFVFFRGQKKIQAKLKKLIDVGLDYIRLGQPANTLSGGESQRLKLAAHLGGMRRARTMFLLDEPTTGLHFADIALLLDCFDALVAVGNSVLIVEHNLHLINAADYIIDLGPGASADGGTVVACGTPEEVARNAASITGQFLAPLLA